jgi:hypothetical protein
LIVLTIFFPIPETSSNLSSALGIDKFLEN